MISRIIVLSTLLSAAPAIAYAQQVDVDSLRKSLAQDSSVDELRRREAALARASKTSVEAMLERGTILLRLYELNGDKDDADEARDITERASKKMPDDPRTHYAYALSNATDMLVHVWSPFRVLDGFVTAQSIAEVVKADPASKAIRSFRKALELDPFLVGAALGLAEISLHARDKDDMQAAAVALRRIVDEKMGGAEAATALSRIESALGNLNSAADAAGKAAGMEAGSSAAARARAAALLRQSGKHDAGAKAYFAGVDMLDGNAANEYFQDMLPIASDRERAEWASADVVAKKALVRRFWDVRAAAGGVTVAERLAEHYKRLATAHEKYRRTGVRGAAPGAALVRKKYSDGMLPFDDRGLILVRHGEPQEIVTTTDVHVRANETWVYTKGAKNQLFNFVVLRDATDYRLVDDLLLAADVESTASLEGANEAIAKLFRDREKYEPRYAAIAERYEAVTRLSSRTPAGQSSFGAAGTSRERVTADMREVAYEALESDSHTPDFTGDLPFYYDLYSFKGEGGKTEVTIGAAIPGTNISGQHAGDYYIYQLQASLILIDTATSMIVRKDTVYALRSPRLLSAGEYLRLHMKLDAPYSSTSMHRVVLRDLITPGVGQLYGGPADLRGFAGGNLMISDIVLAEPGVGSWQRGETALRLVPPRQFEENKPLRVFYEVYNLAPNTQYRTEITLQPIEAPVGFGRLKRLFGGGDGKVQLTFDGTVPDNNTGTVQEAREVTPAVKPGKYKLVVRVTNLADQQTVRSETSFIVSDDKKK